MIFFEFADWSKFEWSNKKQTSIYKTSLFWSQIVSENFPQADFFFLPNLLMILLWINTGLLMGLSWKILISSNSDLLSSQPKTSLVGSSRLLLFIILNLMLFFWINLIVFLYQSKSTSINTLSLIFPFSVVFAFIPNISLLIGENKIERILSKKLKLIFFLILYNIGFLFTILILILFSAITQEMFY